MRRSILVVAVLGVLVVAAHAQLSTVPLQSTGWSIPVSLSTVSAEIVDVSLAVSEGGTVHVVWDDGGRLFHAFGAPIVSSPATDIAYGESPALTGGQGSAAHLAFIFQSDVYASDWTGSAWSLPVSVLPIADESLAPAIARLGTQFALVWAESSDLDEVYLATRTSGAPWVGSAVPGVAGSAPAVCMDAVGTHVLFQARDLVTSKMDLWYTLKSGMGWSLPVSIFNSSDWNSSAGRLACVSGLAHAVWQQATVSGYQIQYAAGSELGWGASVGVSGSGDAFSPDLAAGTDGGLHLAWAQADRVGYRRWFGGVWGNIETLGVPGYPLEVAVGIAPDGTVHLAWVELSVNGTAQVMYAWRAAGDANPTATSTRTATVTRTRTPTATRTATAVQTSTATPTQLPLATRRRYLPMVFRRAP